MQRPHNEREARSGGNKKRVSTVNFDGTKEQVNIMTARDAPIPRKTKGKFQAKNPKSDKENASPKEKQCTYGIDRLNLGNTSVESGNDSKWIIMKRREGHTANEK